MTEGTPRLSEKKPIKVSLSSTIPSVALPDYHLEYQAAVDDYAIQYPYLVHHHHSSTTILSLAVVNCCLAFTIVVVKSSDANKPIVIVSPFVIIHRPIFVAVDRMRGVVF